MGDIGFVLPTGHQGKFKKYLIAYFVDQIRLLIVDQVDEIRRFDSDVIYRLFVVGCGIRPRR